MISQRKTRGVQASLSLPHPEVERRGGDPVSRWIASLVDRLLRRAPSLVGFRQVIETAGRFSGVGVLSSLLFAVAVAIFASGLHIGPRVAALLGYCVVIPLNFCLHREFTFRSETGWRGDLARYAWAQAVGLSVSYGSMAFSVDVLGLPYAFGIMASVVFVPLVNYVLMDRWVFGTTA